jgi:WD40 repeat protein
MRFAFFLVLALVSTSRLPAQQTSLSGPVEAFTFDAPTRSLRAVIGFPGAASFGPMLLDNVDFASIAFRQNYGIVFEGGKCLAVSGLGSKSISTEVVAGVTKYPEGIVWSGNGSLAVLYSRAGSWFQTISGFPSAPVAEALVDISSLGSFTAIAVDPSGQQIVVGVSGANGAVYQAADGQFTPLISMANPVSMSFSSDGQTLYALDASTLQVTASSLSGHGNQTLALPGIANPIAIQAAQDSQNHPLLYIAGGSDRLLRILDVSSQQVLMDVPLNLQPTRLDPFGASSFVLASRAQSTNPLWVFASSPLPGAYFVPAIQLRQPAPMKVAISGRAR